MTQPATAPTVRWAMLTAAWLALAFGIVELALLALKVWGLGVPVFVNPQVVWMATFSYGMVFIPIAVAFALTSRYAPRWLTQRALVTGLMFLGSFSALEIFRVQLYEVAIFLLAAGIAFQVGRLATGWRNSRRVLRTSTAVLAGLIVVLTSFINGAPMLRERREISALPDAGADAPNVLLIIFDTVRALNLALYGYDRPTTPRLDALATRGVVFERATATTSWTNPAHASIFTGHFPNNHSSDWGSGLDEEHPTLAEALRDRGYVTGGFSANTRYVTRQSGLARGYIRFEDFPRFSLSGAVATTWLGRVFVHRQSRLGRLLRIRDVPGRKEAPDISGPLLRWVDGIGDRPFFATLNYMDGHDPYLPPEPYASRFSTTPRRSLWQKIRGRLPGGGDQAAEEGDPYRAWVQREREAYDGSLAYLDAELAMLMTELGNRNRAANTLVILTADHGEEFNEHGIMGHGKSLYWPSVHVPLVLWFPGRVPEGARIDAPVSIRSIPATVLDLLGITDAAFPGLAFARLWEGDTTAADIALSELTSALDAPQQRAPIARGDMKSLLIGSLHYIRNGDGEEELYDIAVDPFERSNLIATVDDSVLAPFRAVIDTIPRRQRANIRQSF